MQKHSIRDLVAEKIETETKKAAEIANDLVKSKVLLTDQRIRDFFPHHEQRWGRSRTNLPRGIPFATQILYGLPTTFDLYPDNSVQFRRRYGIDIDTAISLSKRGRLLPNLYVRDEAAWEGCDDMRELIRLSTANGVRVDAYLKARFPQHDDHMSLRRYLGRSILNDLCAHDASSYKYVLNRLNANDRSAARVLGTRWAYLDSFATDESEVFHKQLNNGNLKFALDYLTVVQHLTVSPISGALGGYFVWSDFDLQTLHRVLSEERCIKSRVTSSIGPWVHAGVETSTDPEFMSFLARYLGGAGALEFLDHATAMALINITDDTEFTYLRGELHAAATQVSTAVGKKEGGLQESAEQWVRATKEMRAKLRTYMKAGQIVLSGIPCVLIGCFLAGWIGAGPGAVFNLGSTQGSQIGRHLHGFMHPENHRFITTLDKIDKLR